MAGFFKPKVETYDCADLPEVVPLLVHPSGSTRVVPDNVELTALLDELLRDDDDDELDVYVPVLTLEAK